MSAAVKRARSPGANPVRIAAASAGESSQVTLAQPTGPISRACTSPITPYSTRGPAVDPAAGLLGLLGDPGLGHDDGHERLVPHRGLGHQLFELRVDRQRQVRRVSPEVGVLPGGPLGSVIRDGADLQREHRH
jgi:hypothetical protein